MKEQSPKGQSPNDQYRKGWSTEIKLPGLQITVGIDDRHQSDSRDLEFMLHPERWPQRPVLPLRHVSREATDVPGTPALALMFEGEAPQVHPGNCWDDPDTVRNKPPEVFTSYSEVLAAGWIVD